jgi:signal transduction histidine kinase
MATQELTIPAANLEAANSTGLLDSLPEEAFDRLTKLAAQVMEAPVALVTILDQHRQFFKSSHGLDQPWCEMRQTPLTHSFCQYVVCSGEPLVLKDAREVEPYRHSLAIPDLNVVAYLGVPLKLFDISFGVLCVIDSVPRNWGDREVNLARDLAMSVMSEVELRLKGRSLEQARRMLEEMVAVQNEFMGMAAHDLRTPLTVALGYSKLLASDHVNLDPPHRKMASAIERNCQFMLRLIDDLLDLEALKSGKLSLLFQTVDLKALLAATVELNRFVAQAKQIEISLRIQPEQDEFLLRADPQKLEQVFNNLVGNAIKYSPTGTHVQVELRHSDGWLELEVKDEGPGMSPECVQRAFQPFQRGESHGQKGTGLGLAIVHRIVEGHHGTVTLSSVVGTGTSFVVRLPALGSGPE